MRPLVALCAAALLPAAAVAQEPIRFARTPDISPDGKTVAFSYLGDIWTVPSVGGVARPGHRDRPGAGPSERVRQRVAGPGRGIDECGEVAGGGDR